MKTKLLACLLAGFCSTAALASNEINPGKNDDEVGSASRAMLKEQTEGKNRGETEPYRAESAGKAYRVYVDSIGQGTEKLGSQITE